MIRLTFILKEISENNDKWRLDWLERHNAIVENGRLVAYHGTPKRNVKSIQKNGFNSHSYFSLRPEYSKRITSIYHDVPESDIVVLKVKLPLDSIDFVMSNIFSTRTINFKETL